MFRIFAFVAVAIVVVQAHLPLSDDEKLQIRAEAQHFTPEDVQILIEHHQRRTAGLTAATSISPDDKDSLIKEYELLFLEAKAVDLSLDDLKSVVSKAIELAKSKLSSMAKYVGEAAKAVIAAAQKAIDGDFADLQAELTNIKDRAKALVVNIKDCLKQKEDQLKGLPSAYGKKLQACGKAKVDEAKALIEKATASVKESINIVKALTGEWKACKSGVSGAACKIKAGYKIAKASVEVPINVVKIASEAIPKLQASRVELTKCASDVGKEFLTEGEGLITYMQDCMVKEIPSTVPPAFE